MTTWTKRLISLAAIAALTFTCAIFCTGCVQEKPSYQAVVVSEQTDEGDLFVIQSNKGEMTSGLIVLHLPVKCDAEPSTLKPGDVLDVFGSNQIAMSYPGQASCSNIKLNGHIEGEAYAPFEAEWNVFAQRMSTE